MIELYGSGKAQTSYNPLTPRTYLKVVSLSATQKLLRFGVYELNLATEELRKGGTPVKLSPQPFQLLALLASRAGQVVTREEIQQQLWDEETFVDFEQGMNHCIKQIRNVLNDNADAPLYVETLPRRGYRFLAPVTSKVVPAPAPRVTESKSGLQSGIAAVVLARQESTAAAPVTPAPASANVVSNLPPAAGATTQPPEVTPIRGSLWSISRVRLMWAVLGLLVLVGGALAYRYWRSPIIGSHTYRPSAVKRRRSVAVLGFQNVSERPEEAWRSTALSRFLNTELVAGDQLLTVPDENINQMKSDLALKDADGYSQATLARIRKYLSVDDVVMGSYTPLGRGDLRLDLRLQDAATGETIASFSEKGSDGQMDELVGRVGATLRAKLGVEAAISPAEAAAVSASIPVNPEVARLYSEGLAKLQVFDAAAARTLLEKTVAAEPDYALAHSALAEALNFLGYDQTAQAEAKKALDLADKLSPEDKLSVQARYLEMTSQWPEAIKLYQTLWHGYPDNLEHGLRLAKAQRSAGLANDALATVGQLRALPPPSRDDPRIDLAEAYAHNLLGEWKLGQAAARKAGEKAHEQSRKLLLAEAQSAEADALLRQEDFPAALRLYKQALDIYQQSGDKSDEASVLNNIGGVFLEQGDLAAAEKKYRDALEIYRGIGAKGLAANTLTNLGVFLQRQRNLDGAEQLYEQALDMHREVKNKSSEAIVLNNMAEVLHDKGDLAGARTKYEQVLPMYDQLADKSGSAYARFGLGEVLAEQGDLAAARKSQEKALSIRESIGESTAESRLVLAALSLDEGRPEDSEANARAAAEEFRTKKMVDKEAQAEAVLARSLLDEGKLAKANESIAHATALAGQIKDPSLRLPVEIEVGIAAARIRAASRKQGDQAEAMASLEQKLAAATRNRLMELQFEAAFALGEIEKEGVKAAAGRARLQALEKDATAHGFLLIARQAAAARQQPAGPT
ncbi:MAG TPA: tetratricopeptide repeat protein [Terriglobales bacterium]